MHLALLDPVDDLSSIAVSVTSPLVWGLHPPLQEEPIVAHIRELGASTLKFIAAERTDFGAIARASKIRVE